MKCLWVFRVIPTCVILLATTWGISLAVTPPKSQFGKSVETQSKMKKSNTSERAVSDELIEHQVNMLLAKMTLGEKIGQVSQYGGPRGTEEDEAVRQGKVGSFLSFPGSAEEIRKEVDHLQHIAMEKSRLHIPLLMGFDAIHGFRTTFPIPLALGASFDPSMGELMGRVTAKEARSAGINWTFGPMIDIARDARWGRIAEGCGEDPYLTSAFAAAMVKGFQGSRLSSSDSIAACAKHFVGYGACEGGRDYDTADFSLSTLNNVYLPPYRAAVSAGVQTVMASFNEIGGSPVTSSRYLLTDTLKKEMGFNGFIVSDANAIYELINHGVAGNRMEAAQCAMTAGIDMDMGSGCYQENLAELIRSGKISQGNLDEAVRRVLRVKFKLGLFENPYTEEHLLEKLVMCPEHVAAARKAAQESIVLLKNDNNLLPLSKDIHSIAVIGPLADDRAAQLGTWGCLGRAEDAISVLDGIKHIVSPQTEVIYAHGCDIPGRYFETDRNIAASKTDGFSEAIDAAKKADAVILVVGEKQDQSGEAGSHASISLSGVQEQLVESVFAAGKPTVVVLMNGRPLAIPWIAQNVSAIVEAWHLGVQAGPATADVLFGDYNPGGKLPATFPKDANECPTYYNRKNSGRPVGSSSLFAVGYYETVYEPVFPFGYGLSYTNFKYSNLKVSPTSAPLNETVQISADITNTGSRTGDEVAQLYLRDVVSSTTRPVKELKGFQRITLKPGETRTVTFSLGPKEIEYYDFFGKPKIEPGLFKVWVGSSSKDGLEGQFILKSGSKTTIPTKGSMQNTGYVGGFQK